MERFELKEVTDLQSIRGIPFPATVSYRQLVVTGPPGVGKTTLVEAIGGWPEEGFVDLVAQRWWRSRILAIRPRQVHLGLPFEGFRKGVSVFDSAWMESPDPPILDLDRIQLPPLSGRRDPWKLRRKYVFEFLLPPAEQVLEARLRRSDRQSHRVDDTLSLDRVKAQLEATWRVAEHLHHAGMAIFVRDAFGGPPKTFTDPTSTEVVEAKLRGEARESRQSFLRSVVKRVVSPSGYRVLDRFEQIDLRGRRALVPLRVLPVELRQGGARIQMRADGERVRVLDPDAYFAVPSIFVGLAAGESVRIPGDSRGLALPTAGEEPEAPPRIEIVHEGEWLAVADLDSPGGTRVKALHGTEAGRLVRDRDDRSLRLEEMLGDLFAPRDPGAAHADLERAIGELEHSRWRPRNAEGRPGGLVELPDDVTPLLAGDLHGRTDNLLTILTEGRTLDALEDGTAALLLLGDVVHPAEGDLSDMRSSLLLTDIVLRLIGAFRGALVHLRGNHETFSGELTKGGVPQGRVWRDFVEEERGPDYVRGLRRFYDLLPYVATGVGFVACHAGPPTGSVSRKRLIQLDEHTRLRHQITWGRVRSPRRPGGYTKRDVRALQKALDQDKPSVLVVSHDPREDERCVVLNHGGIKRHHLVYSARPDEVGVFLRAGRTLVPLAYPARAFPRPDPSVSGRTGAVPSTPAR